MTKNTREANIRRIIELEDRIGQCRRCQGLMTCVRKPSLGKGDLDPEMVLVFESENVFTADLNNLIELRSRIKKEFGIDKIYHTFMVRCKPKSCSVRQSTNYYVEGKLIDIDSKCLLTGKGCDGIPIRPLTEEIISCLDGHSQERNLGRVSLGLISSIAFLQDRIIAIKGYLKY
jgi:hypothetical protein